MPTRRFVFRWRSDRAANSNHASPCGRFASGGPTYFPALIWAGPSFQRAVTSVLALEELLLGFGSGFVPLTVAVFLTVLPAVSGLPNLTVNFSVAPFSEDNDKGKSVPTGQLTVLPVVKQRWQSCKLVGG